MWRPAALCVAVCIQGVCGMTPGRLAGPKGRSGGVKTAVGAGVTSTTPGEMFSLAEGLLEARCDVAIGSVNFMQFGGEGDALLYVPGIEFRGVSGAAQISSLKAAGYQPWIVWVDGEDRTGFDELCEAVHEFMLRESVEVLVGESLGGLVVAELLLSQRAPSRVALINPATSFQRSTWNTARVGEAVSTEGATYAPLIAAAVTFLASDSQMLTKSLAELGRGDISSATRAWSAAQTLARLVPAPTLRFRIEQWLDVGSRRVDQRLFAATKANETTTRQVLVLAGSRDNFLPSASEADRLGRVLGPNATVVILKDGGHALLVDPERLDLGKALRKTLYPQPKRDPVLEYKPPDPVTIRRTRESIVDPLRRLISPVFFSTTPAGTVVPGLGGVPLPRDTQRPVLLVGNHQLFGLDLPILVDAFLRDRDVIIRGLAHPAATGAAEAVAALQQQQSPRTSRRSRRRAEAPQWWLPDDTALRENEMAFAPNRPGDTFFTRFGAVEVTPRNFFRLLKQNETVLLFPGGVKESNHGKGEDHKLFWPPSQDFVRVAASFNADIVPFGACGIADSFSILRNRDQPLFRSDNSSLRVPAARRWAGEDEDFRFPLAIPSPRGPARCYFLFSKPVSTVALNPKDRAACEAVYLQVKHATQSAIDILLQAREADPFERPAPRLAFESISNGLANPANRVRPFPRRIQAPVSSGETRSIQQAPTFPIEALSNTTSTRANS